MNHQKKATLKYSFEAETKSDLEAPKLLVKATALKRRQNDLKIEVKGLQDKIEQERSKRFLADKDYLIIYYVDIILLYFFYYF